MDPIRNRIGDIGQYEVAVERQPSLAHYVFANALGYRRRDDGATKTSGYNGVVIRK